jgi:hypothetical protein
MARAQHIPALTAGGSRDADIATPTRAEVLFPRIDKQTPIPDGTAIAIPVMKPAVSPRLLISSVGQSYAPSVHEAANPIAIPITIHIKRAIHSLTHEDFTRDQSETET